MSTDSDILARARRPQHEANYLLHSTLYLTVLLDAFSHAAVCGAYLKYGGTNLFDSPSNVTLTVGAIIQRVYCLQATGPVPTSIDWYNPQGQLVSSNNRDEVNQAGRSGRVAVLTFQSYNQSQGGKYECRVAGPGNNTQRLPVCIGECHAWGDGCGLLSISVHVALPCQSRWTQFSYTPCMLINPLGEGDDQLQTEVVCSTMCNGQVHIRSCTCR